MLKEFWFKIRNRRNENLSEEIRKDLAFFLDLNYIPEESAREATEALYDAAELFLSQKKCRLAGDLRHFLFWYLSVRKNNNEN